MSTYISSSKIAKGFVALFSVAALTAAVSAQAAPVSGQGTWEATLQGRDINGNPVALNDASAVFFYDTVLNLTWLGDWNANGAMEWGAALAWAAGLSINGFTGWSLPGVLDFGNDGCNFSYAGGTDCGYNVYPDEVQRRGSPLAHMFHDTLDNLSRCPPGDTDCTPGLPTGYGLTNTGPFSNMQSGDYWSSTEYAPTTAWRFLTNVGAQSNLNKDQPGYAVAVRAGDVLASSVPEPDGLALLVVGLGAAAVARRWRAR